MGEGDEDRPGSRPITDGNGTPDQTHYGRSGGGHQATAAAGGRFMWWPAIVVLVAALIYLLSRLGAPQ